MKLEGAGSDPLGPETHCMTLNFTLSELQGLLCFEQRSEMI